jgi:hypothetical protein
MTARYITQQDELRTLVEARRAALPGLATYARGDVCNLLLGYLGGRLDGFPDDMWASAVAYVAEVTHLAETAQDDAAMAAAVAADPTHMAVAG